MSQRSHDARHRVVHQVTSKPRRLIAGLALPTVAAVALMFIAAGTAVATTQPAAFMQNAQVMTSPQPEVVESAAMRNSRLKEAERVQDAAKAVAHAKTVARAKAAHAKTVARAKAVAQAQAVARAKAVARGVARKKLAVRAAEAKRAARAHNWQLPITNPVKTSNFGYRWGRLHAGTDYGVSVGTPLASMSTGTVAFAGQESGYGTIVKIRYWDGTVSYYGHMSHISVKSGQRVAPGQIVGQSGNTGHSTGPHLHLEIHPNGGAPVDPLPWLANRNVAS